MSDLTLTEDALERMITAALDGDREALLTEFSLERLLSSVLRQIELRRGGFIQVQPSSDEDYDDGWYDGRADLIGHLPEHLRSQVEKALDDAAKATA